MVTADHIEKKGSRTHRPLFDGLTVRGCKSVRDRHGFWMENQPAQNGWVHEVRASIGPCHAVPFLLTRNGYNR